MTDTSPTPNPIDPTTQDREDEADKSQRQSDRDNDPQQADTASGGAPEE